MRIENIRLGNGGGTCKRVEEAEEMSRSGLTDISVGSISWDERAGNPGRTLYLDENGIHALNCLNLPNPGMDYWEKHAPEFIPLVRGRNQRARISIVADDMSTLARLAYRAAESGWDDIEMDTSCPHASVRGVRQPVICYEPELFLATLDKVWKRIMPRQIEVKLAPFTNPIERRRILTMGLEHPGVAGVVLCNTFPDAYDLEFVNGEFRPALEANDGYGGMGGSGMLPISLAHVRMAAEIVRTNKKAADKSVTGVGGISNGLSVLKYLHTRATGCQMTTHLLRRDARKSVGQVVHDLLEDLAEKLLRGVLAPSLEA